MPGVGPEFAPSVELLLQHGLAMLTFTNDRNQGDSATMQYFPDSKLSLEKKVQLEKLVAVRKKWQNDDL